MIIKIVRRLVKAIRGIPAGLETKVKTGSTDNRRVSFSFLLLTLPTMPSKWIWLDCQRQPKNTKKLQTFRPASATAFSRYNKASKFTVQFIS